MRIPLTKEVDAMLPKSLIALLFVVCLSVVGCGPKPAEGPSIEEAPATPEAGSPAYDAYNSGSKDGPGAAH